MKAISGLRLFLAIAAGTALASAIALNAMAQDETAWTAAGLRINFRTV